MIALSKRAGRSTRREKSSTVQQAHRALDESNVFRGRSQLIRIDESDGKLLLQGRLPSYYLKQMLQTVLRDVDGVDQIDNQVAVDYPVTESSAAE